MKNYRIVILWLLSTVIGACTDGVDKYDNWPEWKTQDPVTIAGERMNETYYTNYVGKKLYLEKASEVDFTGFEALEFALQPQLWEFISDNKARFKGETGEYDLIYDATNELLYTEQPEKKYPDALYLIGANFGHPGASKVISSTWNLDTPDNGVTCCRTSDNVFEVSLYLAGNFGFKLFKHRNWGTHPEIEIWAQDLTLNEPDLVQGLSSGDFSAGASFQPGIYRLRIDMANHTFSMQPQNY